MRDRRNMSIEDILHDIFDSHGLNIWDYSLSYLQNKISKRMSALNIPDLLEYAQYIQSNPNEYKSLYNTIIGGESVFFRDPEAWNFIKDSVLPNILQTAEDNIERSIRIWSIGCSSGEEPYSLAITLAEILKDNLSKYKIKIYATDIDEPSLTVARNGTYILDQLSEVPDNIKENYFIRHGDFYTISPEIRRLIIFSKHNLISDPPITNIDLLLCRNVLIYIDPMLKPKIIQKLRYALNDKGYLWLGKGEEHIDSSLYGLKPLNTIWRVFKKIPYQDYYQISKTSNFGQFIINNINQSDKIDKSQFKKSIIILDDKYRIISYNKFAYRLFIQNNDNDDLTEIDDRWKHSPIIISNQEISFLDLDICYQIVDFKDKIKYAIDENELVLIDEAEYISNDGKKVKLKIEVVPILSDNPTNRVVAILFEDITKQYELQKRLQMTIESLEASNENLALANAVLKSTTEELEMINEYLQSKNSEELMVISEELAERVSELDILKLYCESIINGIEYGIILVDNKSSIIKINQIALNMLKIKGDIYNKSLLDLDTHIDLSPIFEHTSTVIKTGKPYNYILETSLNNGNNLIFDISIKPINEKKTEGAILIIKERHKLC
ncbi:TPA: PAS domain-containing protein [Candidatus Poribacteria bacterium]|nr:PAS domain-containing protein [Candidatus Poribacteria bacterium]